MMQGLVIYMDSSGKIIKIVQTVVRKLQESDRQQWETNEINMSSGKICMFGK